MRIDPHAEADYRARLAEAYLREAQEALQRGNHRAAVAAAQLAAENAAQAVVALFRIPSWSHDPSYELEELSPRLGRTAMGAKRLAEIAHTLAPEHGRTTYGDPTRGLTPQQIYGGREARRAARMAERAVALMKRILAAQRPKPPR